MEHPLLEFCTTEKQYKVIYSTAVEGLSQRDTAQKLDMSRSAVRDHIAAVKEKAARRGYSPNHDWKNPVPDGHKIKGVSTFYDDMGLPVRQWVKSQTDEQRQFEILVERLENAQSGLPKFKVTAAPKNCDENLLTLLTITDFHLGMYAYCLLYTSPSPRDGLLSRMPSSA